MHRAGRRAQKSHDEARTWRTENARTGFLLTTCNAPSSVWLARLRRGLRTEARYSRSQHHTSARHLRSCGYQGPTRTLLSRNSQTVSWRLHDFHSPPCLSSARQEPRPTARTASLRTLHDRATGRHIDKALVLSFDGPKSFTGEVGLLLLRQNCAWIKSIKPYSA